MTDTKKIDMILERDGIQRLLEKIRKDFIEKIENYQDKIEKQPNNDKCLMIIYKQAIWFLEEGEDTSPVPENTVNECFQSINASIKELFGCTEMDFLTLFKTIKIGIEELEKIYAKVRQFRIAELCMYETHYFSKRDLFSLTAMHDIIDDLRDCLTLIRQLKIKGLNIINDPDEHLDRIEEDLYTIQLSIREAVTLLCWVNIELNKKEED